MSDVAEVRDGWVERVLGVRIGGRAAPEGRAGVRLSEALMVWNAARSYVGTQVETLRNAILAAAADEADFKAIATGADRLEVILSQLDDRLLDKLSAIRMTSDAAEKTKLLGEARSIVMGYQDYLDSPGLMADIDTNNGFVTLDIKPKVSAALQHILGMI